MSNAFHNNDVPLEYYQTPPEFGPEYQQAKAEFDLWQTRASAAIQWFMMNSAQIRRRARAGERVFVDLVSAHDRTRDFKETSKKAFTIQCEIVQAEFTDIVPWPEEVVIARKSGG